MTLAVGVVVVAALSLAHDIVIPITLSILLSFLLAPLVQRLRRLHLGLVPSVLISVLTSLAVIVALAGLIGTQIASLAQNIPAYRSTVLEKVETLEQSTVGRIGRFVGTASNTLQRLRRFDASPDTQAAGRPKREPMPVEIQEPPPSPLGLLQRIVAPILGPIEMAGIVFVITVFILLQREDLRDRLIRLFGATDLHRTITAMDDAAARLSRYFLAQLGVNASVGLAIGIGLAVIGVPSPALWGVLAALLRFVPYIGTWIAALLPISLAAAVGPDWGMAVAAVALFVVVDVTAGQLVEPLLYGRSTGLSPTAVVVSAVFWSWIWGPLGLILSTPLTLCLVVLGRHVDRLEFLDVLLGDQPALTPSETFYQRMLAGDPDEAIAQAETLIREGSLLSYYEEVAVPGLQHAAIDVERGVVSDLQRERIRAAAAELVAGLHGPEVSADGRRNPNAQAHAAAANAEAAGSDIVTVPRPPTQTVLCIAGRGPFDPIVNEIVAQLLQQYHVNARVVPHEAVSRARITEFDPEGATIICLVGLQIRGVSSGLRYLVRRLRTRITGATVLVGIWAEGETGNFDEDFLRSLGVDRCVERLDSLFNACLDAAGRPRATPDAPRAVA
ncbi:AI-2E family transporter [Chitinasiproducens palmae]|nr:AI-2E family transporter [Chitinasiproducens palmae]